MTTKYKMPEPHPHAKLVKAWAEGAVIQYHKSEVWVKMPCMYNIFYEDIPLRIKPTCDYALAKIAELGGDDMVELYLYWLDGGELQSKTITGYWIDTEFWESLDQDPFEQFKELLRYYGTEIRKKKRMVTVVTWVCIEPMGALSKDDFEEGITPKGKYWHKVPSTAREVEAYE